MTSPHRDISPDLLFDLETLTPENLLPPMGVCSRWAIPLTGNGYMVCQDEVAFGLFAAYDLELEELGL